MDSAFVRKLGRYFIDVQCFDYGAPGGAYIGGRIFASRGSCLAVERDDFRRGICDDVGMPVHCRRRAVFAAF